MDADVIPSLVTEAARRYGDREALVDGDLRLTFAELADRTDEVARAYRAVGVARGDRVAVWLPNTAAWVLAALGAHAAGAVLVPLNTRFKGFEAVDILRRTSARALVVADGFLGIDHVALLRAAAVETNTSGDDDGSGPGDEDEPRPVPGLPELRAVVTVPLGDRDTEAPDVLGWDAFLAQGEGSAVPVPGTAPGDVADILFTSGTTGRSKGAMSAHRQSIGVARAWAEAVGMREGDRYLLVNPFFHTFGYKAGVLVCLLTGAAMVPQAVFDVDTTMRLVDRERVTVLPGPPTIYQSILDHPRRPARTSLRVAVTGAATVPVALIERMRDELDFTTVLTAYGLTEAVVVTMSRPEDDPVTIASTCGRGTAGFEVAIMDVDGRTPSPGEVGEVVVRGPNVMLGYLDDPEATAAAVDPNGWLHTGDAGRLDVNGYLTITDRIKDMFTVGGFNVYPAEVERLLAGLDGVADSAVVGVPDDRLGEVAKAYVVRTAESSLTADDVLAHCRRRLANYKVPREAEFVAGLPRNAGGKVLKRELRGG